MNICIFGASSNDIDQAYMDAVFNLGKKLAERGHTLVFGAGATPTISPFPALAPLAAAPISPLAPAPNTNVCPLSASFFPRLKTAWQGDHRL